MATAESRQFSRDYSGLTTDSIVAAVLVTICITWHDTAKRRRRGPRHEEPLGSVESWNFGYLYQGRSWALNPSPPLAQSWPLSWAKAVITLPEPDLNDLRGVDATLYCRFLRGCSWFVLLHTCTTAAILLPIHIVFSSGQYPISSMNRALISSLVETSKGQSLLWIHLSLLLWITTSWVFTLLWICKGAFRYRAITIEKAYERANAEAEAGKDHPYAPHPHPQHPFQAMPPLEINQANRGLRLRTVMITNIPYRLRSEQELKEYFEYNLSRPLAQPTLGLTSSTQPGFFNKIATYALNSAKQWRIFRLPAAYRQSQSHDEEKAQGSAENLQIDIKEDDNTAVLVERVAVVKKMTELASLIDRREDVLKRLETAHIKLAKKVLGAVKLAMIRRERERLVSNHSATDAETSSPVIGEGRPSELEQGAQNNEIDSEDRMDLLIRTLRPYVEEFGMTEAQSYPGLSYKSLIASLTQLRRNVHEGPVARSSVEGAITETPQTDRSNSTNTTTDSHRATVWDALFSLPRSTLDPFQPLIHLSALFRGKTVPSIDYYTAKLELLTSRIDEIRNRPLTEFDAASTAFVTFAVPDHARRACKYLAVHPKNPLACSVTMAPEYEDLDWVRVMKSTFRAEFVKDWVVDLGVWVFTIAWIIPVSALVTLFSIDNISSVLPGLQNFLNAHADLKSVITSLLPTVLTSVLTLLIPLILLLIGKKAHTINTLSALHDRIMTRYHKFLIVNILIFFCLGVTALESFFTSFRSSLNVLQTVAASFPTAGPFYVEWLIFTTAMHSGVELALFGLPLILYPSTKRQLTPRKRSIGIRPRTFNYYYWLPNHLLVLFITLVFAVLNPLLIPFALLYFSVERVVIKNQLYHVYAKNYEGNGHVLLIRLVRYSIDGLILAQVVFLALMAVLKKEAQVAITAVMIAFTAVVKLILTRICRTKFAEADLYEARLTSGTLYLRRAIPISSSTNSSNQPDGDSGVPAPASVPGRDIASRLLALKLPVGFNFTYSALVDGAPATSQPRASAITRFSRLHSWSGVGKDADDHESRPHAERMHTMPVFVQEPRPLSPSPSNLTIPSPQGPRPLVVPHAKHLPWDDTARLDRPYDNPYYVRPLPDQLWLPRNPVGILDLDDTVDVFKSLTSEPGAGRLGEWSQEGELASGLPSTFSLTTNASEMRSVRSMPRRQLTGAEEIELRPALASRVSHLDQEEDIEFPDDQRSLIFRRRLPSNATETLSLRRPSTFDQGVTSGMRTLSGASVRTRSRISQTAASTRMRALSMSESVSSGYPPPSANFASLSRQSQARLRSPSIGISTNGGVSTREAVMEEVIAEERQVNADSGKDSEKTEEEVPFPRSWLTSWMYSHRPWHS